MCIPGDSDFPMQKFTALLAGVFQDKDFLPRRALQSCCRSGTKPPPQSGLAVFHREADLKAIYMEVLSPDVLVSQIKTHSLGYLRHKFLLS